MDDLQQVKTEQEEKQGFLAGFLSRKVMKGEEGRFAIMGITVVFVAAFLLAFGFRAVLSILVTIMGGR